MGVKRFEQFNESKAENKRLIDIWNTYMKFIDGLDSIISETGELLPNYIKEDIINEMNDLTMAESIDLQYIINNKDRIIKNATELLKPVLSAISSNKISEDRHFETGVINKLKTLISKDIIGFKS